MAARMRKAALAALMMGCVPALGADAISKFCKPGAGPDGKPYVLDYQVEPSMVVHDDTLDVTFEDIQLPNQTAPAGLPESLFSFGRTIDTILRSSGTIKEGATDDERQAARAAFVQTMINSFDNEDGVMLNQASATLVPVDDRLVGTGSAAIGEGRLQPAQLLDAANIDFGLKPLALFNRFDLAPADWKHCGENRVIYSLRAPKPGEGRRRFLLIFEAMVPNPYFDRNNPGATPTELKAGCRPLAEYWAELSKNQGDGATRIKRATLLSQLYYDGVDGVTTVKGQGAGNPVLSFRNLGGDGGRGQVRANMFFEGGWQLREWLTQLTVERGGTAALSFVPETVKDNPIAELYQDELTGTELAARNMSGPLQGLHSDFVVHFANTVQNNLLVERSKKYRDLIKQLKDYVKVKDNSAALVTEHDLMLATIALGNDNRFNEFQSISNPMPVAGTDEPSKRAGIKFRTMLEFLQGRPELADTMSLTGLGAQSVDVLLNRAEAGTCAGCHQSSPRDGVVPNGALVRVNANGSIVRWPDVVNKGAGFVHVSEERDLSPALKDHFLPVRRFVMGTHLCAALPEPKAPPSADVAISSVEGTGPGVYFVDEVIADFVGKPQVRAAGEASIAVAAEVSGIAALLEADQQALVGKLTREIRSQREIEQRTPGAFVEVRRPH